MTHTQEAEPPDFSNEQKTSDIQEISSSSPANCIRRKPGTVVRFDWTLQRDNQHHRHVPIGEKDPSTATCLRRCKISHSRIWMLRIKNYLALKQLSKERLRKPDKVSNFWFLRLKNISSPTLRHNRSYEDLANFVQTMVDTSTKLGFHHDLHSTLNWSTSANLTHIQHQVSIIADCLRGATSCTPGCRNSLFAPSLPANGTQPNSSQF